MRRTIAGTAVLVTALTIGAPMASASPAAPATLHCAGSAAVECELLDDLAAQLGPITPLLGTLAPVAAEAQDLATRSDSAAGVPTAEVVAVSSSLLDGLDALPAPVQALVGATRLGDVADTLQALVATLTAPPAESQQSSAGSGATPAQATSSSTAAPFGGARAADAGSSGATTTSSGGATSGDAVPAVPVGDPLALAPLALPDFGFDQAFVPAPVEVAAPSAEDAQLAALTEAIDRDGGRTAELAVAAVMSLLLLAGAGIAQLQANRHQIPD
jgi:hypothetical protein